MGRENGGNGGRAQMNFINATTDMKWRDRRACLVVGMATLYLLFQKHEASPLS